jgi:hypothetical protein
LFDSHGFIATSKRNDFAFHVLDRDRVNDVRRISRRVLRIGQEDEFGVAEFVVVMLNLVEVEEELRFVVICMECS